MDLNGNRHSSPCYLRLLHGWILRGIYRWRWVAVYSGSGGGGGGGGGGVGVGRSWWLVDGKVEERRTCVVYCRIGRPGPGFRVLTFYSFLEWTIVAAVKDQHPDDDGGDKRNGLGLFNGKSFRFSSSLVCQSLARIVTSLENNFPRWYNKISHKDLPACNIMWWVLVSTVTPYSYV